jgi:hypothetical protein
VPDCIGTLDPRDFMQASPERSEYMRTWPLSSADNAGSRGGDNVCMIRRYIIWRSNHAYDERLRRIVAKANLA